MIRSIIASLLILTSLGVEGFNLYLYLKNLMDYDRRMEMYSLRENTLRLEYFQVVSDQIGITSTLYQIKDGAIALGDSTLVALSDSLKETARSGDFGKYTQAILSYTEDYLSRPIPRVPLWSIISTFFLGVFGVMLIITDVLVFRRNLKSLNDYVLNLRMGILSNRSPVKGDFKSLGESLVELAEDLERTRKNARQLIQS